jgi:hypothetical protein
MQPTAAPVEQPAGERKQSQNQRVQPYQGIKDEIRPQPAQPTVLFLGNCVRTSPRRGRLRRFGSAFYFHW